MLRISKYENDRRGKERKFIFLSFICQFTKENVIMYRI